MRALRYQFKTEQFDLLAGLIHGQNMKAQLATEICVRDAVYKSIIARLQYRPISLNKPALSAYAERCVKSPLQL